MLVKFNFKNAPITFENENGIMVNATEMAKPFDTKPANWLRTEQAQRMISAVAVSHNCDTADLVRVTQGGSPDEQGTWFHEDIALVFAQWLSPEFYLWCNDRIKELLTKGTVSLPQDYLSALKALVAAEEEKQRLASENRVMKPKAEYFDALVDRKLLTNFRDTAKELGFGQNAFIDWLFDRKFIYRDKKRQIRPYSDYANTLFEIKEFKASYGTHAGVQTLITPKGRETFRLLLGRD